MLKRTITGAFITVAVYLMIYFSHIPSVILCATAILCGFSVYEIYRATDTVGNEVFFTLSMLTSTGLAFWDMPYYQEILGVAFILAVLIFVWMMIRGKRTKLSSPIKASLIALLIVLLFKAMPQLRGLDNGLYYLTFAITLCFVTDIAAYLIGRSLGRHKLIPKVSPNKTIEGSVAGVIFAVLIMLLGGILLERIEGLSVDYVRLCVYALCASVVGQFGDLAMSAVKRACGIKDFGNLFPGHGGILDRFDSHLFSISFTFLFCIHTGGFLK